MAPTQQAKASAQTRPPASGLLHWGPVVAFGLLLVGLSRSAAGGVSDPDTPWHILAGRHLWATGQFVGADPLSSFTTEPWVLNQWLPDLLFAGAERLAGLGGVLWLAQLGRVAICVAVYVTCRRRAGALPAALGAGAAVLGTADSLSPRPQLVGFVLLAITVDAWLRTAGDLHPRRWLLVVGYVWACSHGTWVAGVTVGLATVAGLVLPSNRPRRATSRDLARLAVIPVGTLALAAATPVGPALFTSFHTVRAVSPYIQEWRLPTLESPSVLVTVALLLLPPLVWLVRRRLPPWPQLALWLVAAGWGMSSMRTVAVGAIIVAPLAAESLDSVLGRERAVVSRGERRVLAAAAAVALGLSALLAALGPVTPTKVPVALDDALDALPGDTVIYNTDLLGGWLLWAHPELDHTADTRWELYGAERAREYLAVANAAPGWRAGFERFRPGAVLVEEHVALVRALEREGWRIAGRDAGYLLLVPR